MKTARTAAGTALASVMAASLIGSVMIAAPAAAISVNTNGTQASSELHRKLQAAHASAGVADVLKLVNAKVDVATIEAFVINSPVAYDLRADEILALQEKGVPQTIIVAMIERGGVLRSGAPSQEPSKARGTATTGSAATIRASTLGTFNYCDRRVQHWRVL
jgi:hypothetical protein